VFRPSARTWDRFPIGRSDGCAVVSRADHVTSAARLIRGCLARDTDAGGRPRVAGSRLSLPPPTASAALARWSGRSGRSTSPGTTGRSWTRTGGRSSRTRQPCPACPTEANHVPDHGHSISLTGSGWMPAIGRSRCSARCAVGDLAGAERGRFGLGRGPVGEAELPYGVDLRGGERG
jgi:hypothetical protein